MFFSATRSMLTGALLAVLALGGASGCAPMIQVDQFRLNKIWYDKAVRDIKSRAAFELNCPAEQLHLTVLSVYSWNDAQSNAIGVSGCNQRVVYVNVVIGDSWVLNTQSGEPPKKPAPEGR